MGLDTPCSFRTVTLGSAVSLACAGLRWAISELCGRRLYGRMESQGCLAAVRDPWSTVPSLALARSGNLWGRSLRRRDRCCSRDAGRLGARSHQDPNPATWPSTGTWKASCSCSSSGTGPGSRAMTLDTVTGPGARYRSRSVHSPLARGLAHPGDDRWWHDARAWPNDFGGALIQRGLACRDRRTADASPDNTAAIGWYRIGAA